MNESDILLKKIENKDFNETAPSDQESESANLLNSEDQKFKDKAKGLLYGVMVTLLVATSATSVPLLERKIPDFELNLIRSGVSLTIFSIMLIFKRQSPLVPKAEICGLAAGCVMCNFQNTVLYVTVTLIPLAYLKSLYMSMNIISGLILFPIFLKEKTDLKRLVFAVFCVAGVILSIQPDFIFTWKKHQLVTSPDNTNSALEHFSTSDFGRNSSNHFNKTEGTTAYKVTPLMTTIGCILATIIGITCSVNVIIMKNVSTGMDKVLLVSFWISLLGTIMSLIVMLIFEDPVLPSTWKQFILLAIHSLTMAVIAPMTLVVLIYISGNAINIIYSSLVVFMLIPQYTLLKHILPGNRNWIEVLGTVLVFIGATSGSIWELLQSRRNVTY